MAVVRTEWQAPLAMTPDDHNWRSFKEAFASKPGLYVSFTCGRRGAGSVSCQFCGAPLTESGEVDAAEMRAAAERVEGRDADMVMTDWGHKFDACAGHDPGREMGPVFGPFEYAELTYQWLRVDDGEHLACWDDDLGDWVLLAAAGDYARESYSDATIAYYG